MASKWLSSDTENTLNDTGESQPCACDEVKHHPALLMWVAGNEQLGADIVLGMVPVCQ